MAPPIPALLPVNVLLLTVAVPPITPIAPPSDPALLTKEELLTLNVLSVLKMAAPSVEEFPLAVKVLLVTLSVPLSP
jgi:hypothetical protein